MRACHHDGEIGFGLFAVSQRYAIDAAATAAGGGVSPPMTLQYQLTVASESVRVVFVCLSVVRPSVHGVIRRMWTDFPASLWPPDLRLLTAVVSVDGSRQ